MRTTTEPLDVDRDLGRLHRWVTHPRSVFWGMQGASVQQVAAEYRRIADDPHHDAFLGRVDGEPAFLVERYDPACSPLAALPELREGDVGMHVLVAPPEGEPRPGFTDAAFAAALDQCFADPAARRVVVEPDTRNDRIRAKNVAAGFVELREVALPGKTAMLSVCTRADWERARAVAHLAPEPMEQAQRRLVAKAIAEYAHERLLAPRRVGPDAYVLDGPGSTYTFTARVHALDHWVVDPGSLTRTVAGRPAPVDAQDLVAELAPRLGIPRPAAAHLPRGGRVDARLLGVEAAQLDRDGRRPAPRRLPGG
ncbi:GNAT family N-acetyltransferase [Nocardioides sp. TF02-7]|uniref:GNAT family N-acetyltransferase n=1 Tax=Nocardioides sp. TF02-7 TaxID=2917724 RepID=UPI001F061138|nr:GNAT family N-acetyltransferase [Nocardioides sp. TF02-7]UMG93804.1 acetyltransferase [Nocardioides sp. TF02-7]